MSDLMREEFEAWFLANAPKLSEKASWLDPDAMAIRRLARHAWQASRECLVIELPDRFDEHYQDYYEDVDGGCFNEGRYINDVHAALTEAGVKTK